MLQLGLYRVPEPYSGHRIFSSSTIYFSQRFKILNAVLNSASLTNELSLCGVGCCILLHIPVDNITPPKMPRAENAPPLQARLQQWAVVNEGALGAAAILAREPASPDSPAGQPAAGQRTQGSSGVAKALQWAPDGTLHRPRSAQPRQPLDKGALRPQAPTDDSRRRPAGEQHAGRWQEQAKVGDGGKVRG